MNTYISEQVSVNRCWRWNLNIGNRETENMYSVYIIVRTVYSTCKWDRIVRTVVQYVLWCHTTTSSSSAGIAVDSEDITLNLDSEELHYLCQETNRPTLGVNWDGFTVLHILIVVLYRTLFIVIKRCLVCVHIVREF